MGFWFGNDDDDENAQDSRETRSKETPKNADASAKRKRAADTEGAPSEKKKKTVTVVEQQPSVDDPERPNNDDHPAAIVAPTPKHSPTLEKKIVDYMKENPRPEGFTYVELRTMIDSNRRIPVDKGVLKASLDYLVQRGRLVKYRLRYYIPTGDNRLRVVVNKTATKCVVTKPMVRIPAPRLANAATQFPTPQPESPMNMETEQDGNTGDNPGVVSTTDNAKPETPKPAPKKARKTSNK